MRYIVRTDSAVENGAERQYMTVSDFRGLARQAMMKDLISRCDFEFILDYTKTFDLKSEFRPLGSFMVEIERELSGYMNQGCITKGVMS